MTTLSDGTVAVSGQENIRNRLKRFSLETGRELISSNITRPNLHAMTEVKLGVNWAIALSDQ